MDPLESLEIYIPVEAEVKNIPLWTLPNSVLRRMGLPLSDTKGSMKLAESPEGIWICPAVLRRKGQKPTSHTGNSMASLMASRFRATPGPFRMSFVSSNHAAYMVLKNTMSGKKVSPHKSHSSVLPPGSAPKTYQDAVVVYQKRIYLSIRKRNRGQRETHEPQPAPQSPIPSTSAMSSKSQKKFCASLRITLPQISTKQPKDLIKNDSHFTTDQVLRNDNSSKKKHTTYKVRHSENRKDVTHEGRDVSSSKTAHSVPQSTDGVHNVHSHCHKDAKGEKAAEETAGPETALFQPWGKHEEVANTDSEIHDLDGEEAESTSQNNDIGSNMKIDGGETDNIVGILEQSSNQSLTRRESQGAAYASTSLQQVDFKELAQEEKIARMKAKLRQSEAALNNLQES